MRPWLTRLLPRVARLRSSEAEYITSVFYEGDDALGKFFYRGKRFMITRRIPGDQLYIASPDATDVRARRRRCRPRLATHPVAGGGVLAQYPKELAPLVYGKSGGTAACIM